MPETLQETIAEPAFPAFTWQVVRFIFFILTMLLLEVLHVGVEPVPETDREEVFPGLRVRAVLFSLGDSVTFIPVSYTHLLFQKDSLNVRKGRTQDL